MESSWCARKWTRCSANRPHCGVKTTPWARTISPVVREIMAGNSQWIARKLRRAPVRAGNNLHGTKGDHIDATVKERPDFGKKNHPPRDSGRPPKGIATKRQQEAQKVRSR